MSNYSLRWIHFLSFELIEFHPAEELIRSFPNVKITHNSNYTIEQERKHFQLIIDRGHTGRRRREEKKKKKSQRK